MILQFQIERKNKIENSSRTAWGEVQDVGPTQERFLPPRRVSALGNADVCFLDSLSII